MSLEIFFRRESLTFQFVSVALFFVLYGVSGSVGGVFAWCSMLFCVTFNVGLRGIWVC